MTPAADFRHLLALSTDLGVFEHCAGAIPRPEHGFCTDDVSRALVCVVRESTLTPPLRLLAHRCLDFLEDAIRDDGFVNRRAVDGTWAATADDGDATGRAIWAVGSACGHHDTDVSRRSCALFETAATFRSRWLRATAHAVVGAGAALERPGALGAAGRRRAESLLEDAQLRFHEVAGVIEQQPPSWPWPEPRLTYSNALIPQGLLVAGVHRSDERLCRAGFRSLEWLRRTETAPLGRLSLTPAGGWALSDERPSFDQQPIEAASLADAAWTAWSVSHDPDWLRVIDRCAEWFTGRNDADVVMIDSDTGGCHDGLTPTGVNLNQGAESTIAAILTMQLAARIPVGAA